jgi:hypothetical protein
MGRHLDPRPTIAFSIRGYERRTGASERIENAAALLANPHQLAHEIRGLSSHVMFVRFAYRLPDDPRQYACVPPQA